MTEIEKENEKLKETAEGLLKIQYALADSCNKYSKALEEIRQYCLKTINIPLERQEILTIINEVLNDI